MLGTRGRGDSKQKQIPVNKSLLSITHKLAVSEHVIPYLMMTFVAGVAGLGWAGPFPVPNTVRL